MNRSVHAPEIRFQGLARCVTMAGRPVISNVLCRRCFISDCAMSYRLSTLLLLVAVAAICTWGYCVALPAYRIVQIKHLLERSSGGLSFAAEKTQFQTTSRPVDESGGQFAAFMNSVYLKCDFVEVHADRAISTGKTEAVEIYAEGNVVIKSAGTTIESSAVYLRTGPESMIATDLDVDKDASTFEELQEKLYAASPTLARDDGQHKRLHLVKAQGTEQ